MRLSKCWKRWRRRGIFTRALSEAVDILEEAAPGLPGVLP